MAFLESSIYRTPGLRMAHAYLLPSLLKVVSDLKTGLRILDVGCGNGSIAAEFARRGHHVTGIDLAEKGIWIARTACPDGRFEVLPADAYILDNLNASPFDLVYSVEVIEHLYDPRSFLAGCFAATRPGGRFIVTTPYHGYLKNLALSLAGNWDKHANPLFDGGHIKLFSRKTLESLLVEAGFEQIQFHGSGRVPYLWKSMIMSATKPIAQPSSSW